MLRDHINDRFIVWQFFEVWRNGDQIIKSTTNHTELVKGFMHDINNLKNVDPDSYSLTMSMEEGVNLAMEHITERRENPIDPDRVRVGIKALDDIYNGFEKGSYTVVSGMINGGKTTLLMNIGFNMAKAGYNVAYVSLEKKAELFYRRLLSLHSSTDYNRIKRGGKEEWGITDHWYSKLQEGAKDLLENIKPHYDCLQFVQQTKLTKILSDVDKIRKRKSLDVLIVDYLGVIGFETHTVGRPDLDLANIHQRLMAYGRTHNLVTLTALQLKSSSSKEIRKKAQKVGTDADVSSVEVNTEDYSGSQMIIADADNALGCVLNADHPPTKMYVSLSKARDDESRRTITLDFDGKLGKVSDPEFTPEQIRATHDYLYDSNVDNEQLERELTSDDDLFTSVSDSDGGVLENSGSTPPSAPKPDIIDELDEVEPNITGAPEKPIDLDGIDEPDNIDDGDVEDIFTPNEFGD
jgi:RecA/RadA recombinase